MHHVGTDESQSKILETMLDPSTPIRKRQRSRKIQDLKSKKAIQ